MSNIASAPLSVVASQVDTASVLGAKFQKMNAQAEQNMANIIADNAANAKKLEALPQPGSGTLIDKSV